ncbi:VOC family protein [Streptomyces montanisoli]|uniref:VOC family protein n=1 Tax=Streptomyces montanisoli TaxID=2798581 RepID=A0A940MBZ1_9ACTN|nr:VOC family protein [Streptomyces montanisoli]MBP0458177.1 VOC family protein [Streptomyces montanisoli]
MTNEMAVCQVAFSVLDLRRTMSWYQEVLGFLPSGGSTDQGGPEAAAMQGLPVCRLDMAWMVGRQDFFQLEFFRYHEPRPAPRRPDAHPSDLGWAAIGLWVADFDKVVHRLGEAGTPPATPVTGSAPGRRVGVRDPEGVLLEIMESDVHLPGAELTGVARPEADVAVRFARLVVRDIGQTRTFFEEALGFAEAGQPLHDASHEPLWLGEPPQETLLLRAGHFLLELVSYPDSRDRPEGYLISDQGLLNIALGSRHTEDYRRLLSRARDSSATVHGELRIGSAAASYLTGPGGISVELLTIPDLAIERAAGFHPLE